MAMNIQSLKDVSYRHAMQCLALVFSEVHLEEERGSFEEEELTNTSMRYKAARELLQKSHKQTCQMYAQWTQSFGEAWKVFDPDLTLFMPSAKQSGT